MKNPHNFGVVLIVLGVLLLIFGFVDLFTPANVTHERLTGYNTLMPLWYTIGGILLVLIGWEVTSLYKDED